MVTLPVPDFFQDESEPAQRLQVEWLERHAGLNKLFLADLLRVDTRTFDGWLGGELSLPAAAQGGLCALWRTLLHLLSFVNFDEERLRVLLDHPVPVQTADAVSPFVPPWSGSTLRAHLEARGLPALVEVDRWVTSFRFGDPYAA
jgi:hypothetical protein